MSVPWYHAEDQSLCKQQSWVVSFFLCYMLKFHYNPSHCCFLDMSSSIPSSYFTNCFVTSDLCTHSWQAEYKVQSIALWLLGATFGNVCYAYPREGHILGTILQTLGTEDKNTRCIINSLVFLGCRLIPLFPFFFLLRYIQWHHLTGIAFAKITQQLFSALSYWAVLYMWPCWPLYLSKISLPPGFPDRTLFYSLIDKWPSLLHYDCKFSQTFIKVIVS